ncbi:MAG: SUMF1/EgtB/PvdO family nonheme iron enzyme [Sedimentisphaerales bacterium]|nr:SUMF1/EgtB/PvdO family nonheme iron enzyme [Sedimentisphaerales bacterium]
MLRRIYVIMVLCLIGSIAIAQDSDRGVLIGTDPRTEAGGQRWALIIGINDYTNVPTLRYGRSDAETLAKVLIEQCGFPKDNVVLMTDSRDIRLDSPSLYPTRGNLYARLSQIAQVAKANDLLLISFAGHGINVDGWGFLMPADGTTVNIDTLVPLSWVKETLESSAAKQRLLILDACHSGARAADDKSSPASALLSPLSGAAFATLASCDSDQLSHEDNNIGGGIFTNSIIEGLQGKADKEAGGNNDGVLTAYELFSYASLNVRQWSLTSGMTQTPVLRGEFKGEIELARFKTADELKIQKEELQKRLEQIKDKETSSVTEQLQKEIAELEVQLQAITGGSSEGVGTSDDFEAVNARFESAKKQVEDIKALLIETLKTYQPTSSTVSKIQERLEVSQAELKKSAEVLDGAIDKQIKSKQSSYNELIKELLPSAPRAQKVKQEIDSFIKTRMEMLNILYKGEVITNTIGMELIYIPSGEFMMGSPSSEEKRKSDEGPQHRVTISKGFWMGVYEVTQAEYEAVMGSNPSYFKGDNLPVEQVSWNYAVEFCKKLTQKEGKTYRLPTEAEWEYSCRAGTTTPFNTGQTISTDQANYDGNYVYGNGREGIYLKKTTAVGSFQPNAFGLYDMHGSVWEWCQDWYDKNYYSNCPSIDPEGPSSGSSYVLRGGSWFFEPWYCRSAHRSMSSANLLSSSYGFRVVVLDF